MHLRFAAVVLAVVVAPRAVTLLATPMLRRRPVTATFAPATILILRASIVFAVRPRLAL